MSFQPLVHFPVIFVLETNLLYFSTNDPAKGGKNRSNPHARAQVIIIYLCETTMLFLRGLFSFNEQKLKNVLKNTVRILSRNIVHMFKYKFI